MLDLTKTSPAVTILAHEVTALGGMERVLTRLITGLLERGVDVTVIASRFELRTTAGNLRVVRIRGPRRPFVVLYVWYMLSAGLALRRHGRGVFHATGAIVPNRVDVTTVHYCHAAARARVPDRARGPAWYHRRYAELAARLSQLAERWCYRPGRVKRLVGVSGGVSRELKRYYPATTSLVVTIPNGVDLDEFRPDAEAREAERRALGLGPDELVVLFVGGDWTRKGLAEAIEGVARTQDWRLIVIGRGDRDAYLRRARQLGAAARIRFLEPTPRITQLYQAADAFLLPTAYETFSLVTYEAAASGLPLLVSRVNGVEDLLEDGLNGWFIGRAPGAIAERLDQLAANPGLRRTMGCEARARSAQYDWNAVTDAYLALYHEVCAEIAP
jgi:glycosyltransferase involved in cell wall biosynthesis